MGAIPGFFKDPKAKRGGRTTEPITSYHKSKARATENHEKRKKVKSKPLWLTNKTETFILKARKPPKAKKDPRRRGNEGTRKMTREERILRQDIMSLILEAYKEGQKETSATEADPHAWRNTIPEDWDIVNALIDGWSGFNEYGVGNQEKDAKLREIVTQACDYYGLKYKTKVYPKQLIKPEIKDLIGKLVDNDGNALREVLGAKRLKHTGHFNFIAESETETHTIRTQPVDEEETVIKILEITTTARHTKEDIEKAEQEAQRYLYEDDQMEILGDQGDNGEIKIIANYNDGTKTEEQLILGKSNSGLLFARILGKDNRADLSWAEPHQTEKGREYRNAKQIDIFTADGTKTTIESGAQLYTTNGRGNLIIRKRW